MSMQAKELNLLFFIKAVIYQGHAEKQELSRTSTVDEVDNALLNADGYILKQLLMVCTAFMSSDEAAMLDVLANTTVTSEVQLRAEISNALRRLDGVDDSAVLSSKVVATCAQVGDFLHGRDQTTLINLVGALRTDASFGDLPTVYLEIIDSEIAISREPSTVEEAIKVLLEVEDESATDLPTFKTLASVCLLLQDCGDDVLDLVKAAYTGVLSKLSGEMQFVLGMAETNEIV